MPKALIEMAAIAAAVLLLGACTDAATLLAGGVKGYCNGSPGGACSRPPPGYTPTTPQR